jgi:hypothetical protein
MLNKKDIYRHLRNLKFSCGECNETLTYWLVSDNDWYASGFGKKPICKSCFEERVPNPRYMTFEEYSHWCLNEYGSLPFSDIEEVNKRLDKKLKMYVRAYGLKEAKDSFNPKSEL